MGGGGGVVILSLKEYVCVPLPLSEGLKPSCIVLGFRTE